MKLASVHRHLDQIASSLKVARQQRICVTATRYMNQYCCCVTDLHPLPDRPLP
jgi:hypothetical protein